MKKIISMLLAVSMSLSIICSSFTVSAIDENNAAAAQTETPVQNDSTGFEGLFANELNGKIAEKSNDCGINSVEVSGNTAAVSYWANKDCTVIVGIYEDDGTNGTHMLTFGTANIKASAATAEVTINNLPKYFYLKAYLVDSESYRPLSVVYENSNYTRDMKEFFDYSIYDFEPEDVWNFDDNPDNNFMVLADNTVTVNMELVIDSSEVAYTADSIRVNDISRDSEASKLKKGSPFMFFVDAETMLYGTVSNISKSGGETVIQYDEAQIGDLFEYIRIETENVVNEEQAVSAYSMESYALAARSPDYSNYKKAQIKLLNTSFEPFRFVLSQTTNDGKNESDKSPIVGSASGSGTLSLNVNADVVIYYMKNLEDLILELIVTPKATISVSGSGSVSYINSAPIDLKIASFMVGPVEVGNLKATLSAGYTLTVSADGTVILSTKYIAAADFKKTQHDKILSFSSEPQTPSVNLKAQLTFSMPIKLEVKGSLLDTPFGAAAKVGANTSLTGSASGALKTNNFTDLNKKHACDTCIDGTVSLKLDGEVFVESPVLKLFGDKDGNLGDNDDKDKLKYGRISMKLKEFGFNLPHELVPKDFQKFHVNANGFNWGECDNYSYRTYIQLAEKTTKKEIALKDVYIVAKNGQNNMEGFEKAYTDSTGKATLYLKKNYAYNFNADTVTPNDYFYAGSGTVSISDANEKHTIELSLRNPPDSITPIPKEDEDIPKYIQGEELRYTGIIAEYDIGNDVITIPVTITSDMVKEFDTSKLGMQPLVLEYKGTKWSQQIEVIEDNRELQSVFLSPVPKKTKYKTGETLELGEAKLNAVYKNINTGKTEIDKDIDITSDMVSGFDTSTEGEKEVTVTFTDVKGQTASTSFTVTVVDEKREVESIKIKTLPNKTEYALGEALDITGLTIDVNFTDGTSDTDVVVSSSNVTGFESETAGTKTLTVTYTDKYDNEATASFDVEVVSDSDVESIEVFQLLDQNKYCEINKDLNLEGAFIKAFYTDGTTKIIPITQEMVNSFDSSRLGKFPVTVTYGKKETSYEVEVLSDLHKVIRIEIDNYPIDSSFGGIGLNYYADEKINVVNWALIVNDIIVRKWYADGTNRLCSGNMGSWDRFNYEITDDYVVCTDQIDGDKIKLSLFDIHQLGAHKVTATYCLPDGTIDTSVEKAVAWIGCIEKKEGEISAYYNTPINEMNENGEIIQNNFHGREYSIGESFDINSHYVSAQIILKYNDEGELKETFDQFNCEYYDDNGVLKVKPEFYLKNATLLDGADFDTSSPTCFNYSSGKPHYRRIYFEYDGFVIAYTYVVKGYTIDTETASYSNFNNYAEYDYGFDDWTYEPAFTDETEIPDNTEPDITEPVVTEPKPEEIIVTETAAIEETPLFGFESSGIFGFGRAAAKKSAQFTNLHKNDIYNCYVVRSASSDILGRDNLLFVGQTSSDGNGSLSFEYETVTGEDGTIILRPMSDDPTTPDTPNHPAVPDNGGSSSNTNSGIANTVGGTKTETMTIKVENKITGKTSKAAAQKTGSSVTVKLGTENNGYYANVYTADDEYIYSALIKNGRVKFTVPDDVKLKIVIDSIAYGEDVSSAAGVFGDSAAEGLPYAAITIMIAVVGIYFKKRSEKKVK